MNKKIASDASTSKGKKQKNTHDYFIRKKQFLQASKMLVCCGRIGPAFKRGDSNDFAL